MNKLFYLLPVVAGVIILGSIIIFLVESPHENSQIKTMLDAVWWTVATVTTVGYGDIVLVSDEGRIIAMFFMFFGIGVIAIFLSVLGTNFYNKQFQGEEKEITHGQDLILKKIEELEKNQKKIQEKLDELSTTWL